MSRVYKRRTESERKMLFAKLAQDIGHDVINVTPPQDKSEIKAVRKAHGLNGKQAAAICGVTRRTWTLWENYQKVTDDQPSDDQAKAEAYPSDWQWGWFLLAINQHPTLRLSVKEAKNTASDTEAEK